MALDSLLASSLRRSLVASVLIFGLAGGARAGVEEDYAAGLLSYQRADFATAIPVLRKAADAGHAQSQALLASILDAADQDEEAVAYYRKAAASGNLDGIFGLGTMFAAGEGVAKNVVEARKLYTRAAEAGHKPAIAALAAGYIHGDLGIPESERKGSDALKWITSAADDGFVTALEALEAAHRTGGYGLSVNIAKADEYRKKLDALKGIKERKGRRRSGEKQ